MDKNIQSSKMRLVLKAFLKTIPEPITNFSMNLADEFEKIENKEELAKFENRLNEALKYIEIEEHQYETVKNGMIQLKYMPVNDKDVVFYLTHGIKQCSKDLNEIKGAFTVRGGILYFEDKEEDFEGEEGTVVYHRKKDARILKK